MNTLKMLIAGSIGGLLGALIWAGISYATNYEIGWIAWGMGFVVGVCVRMAAGEQEGAAPGGIAAVLALGSVLLGKYLAVYMLMMGLAGNMEAPDVTADDMKLELAQEVFEEREQAGRPVAMPPGKTSDDIETLAELPQEVRVEADKRWNALPTEEQSQRIATSKENFVMVRDMILSSARGDAFSNSFSPFDLLWFGLAAYTAFRIGAGGNSDE